jgi:hypothetical protein
VRIEIIISTIITSIFWLIAVICGSPIIVGNHLTITTVLSYCLLRLPSYNFSQTGPAFRNGNAKWYTGAAHLFIHKVAT